MGLDLVNGAPAKRALAFEIRAHARQPARPESISAPPRAAVIAGVPLVEGLMDLRESMDNPRFREVVSG